jgi:hypothetical protein
LKPVIQIGTEKQSRSGKDIPDPAILRNNWSEIVKPLPGKPQPYRIISNWFVFIGFLIMWKGWRLIHGSKGKLVT